jgi:transcription antitermination factor NusG
MEWAVIGNAALIGEAVRVCEGPLTGHIGTLVGVVEERGLAIVELRLFNRSTPIKIEFWYIERFEAND